MLTFSCDAAAMPCLLGDHSCCYNLKIFTWATENGRQPSNRVNHAENSGGPGESTAPDEFAWTLVVHDVQGLPAVACPVASSH